MRSFFPFFVFFTQNSCATTQINFERRSAPNFFPPPFFQTKSQIFPHPHLAPQKKPLVPSPSKALGRVLQHGQHAHRGGRVAERWGLWGRRARELGAVPSGQRPLQHAEPRPGMDGMGWDVVLGPLGFWTLHFAHFFIQGKTSQQRFLVVTSALLVANLLVVVNSYP